MKVGRRNISKFSKQSKITKAVTEAQTTDRKVRKFYDRIGGEIGVLIECFVLRLILAKIGICRIWENISQSKFV